MFGDEVSNREQKEVAQHRVAGQPFSTTIVPGAATFSGAQFYQEEHAIDEVAESWTRITRATQLDHSINYSQKIAPVIHLVWRQTSLANTHRYSRRRFFRCSVVRVERDSEHGLNATSRGIDRAAREQLRGLPIVGNALHEEIVGFIQVLHRSIDAVRETKELLSQQ